MTEGVEQAGNYYRWIYRQFLPYLRPPILEVGSGRGGLSSILLNEFPDTVLLDIDHEVVQHLSKRFPKKREQIIHGDISDGATRRRMAEYGFRTAIHTNTLEHVRDDVVFLRGVRDSLAEGGSLCALVPAHPRLYNAMDRLAGHYRRYTRVALREAVVSAGFELERIWHMNAIGALGWMINKYARHDNLTSPSVNRQLALFDRFVVPGAEKIENIFHLPFGLSLLCVAKK